MISTASSEEADCPLTASDPEALVTHTYLQFVRSATPAFFTQLGLALGFNVTEPIDFESDGDLEGLTFVTVDVPLDQGWNQVTWSFTETTFTIGARSIDSAVYSVPFSFRD